MSAEELAGLVKQMRAAQSRYDLWSRYPADLAAARDLEREVDAAVVSILTAREPNPSPVLNGASS